VASYVTELVELRNLRFDPSNMRLPRDAGLEDQTEILVYMAQTYELEEIGWSMAEHGYFEEEPLLTVALADDTRLVVEGNRRLATLKLLTDPEARKLPGISAVWEELAAFAADHKLDPVPTHRYPDSASLLGYLGFRHVSGLMEWSPDAKARFIYSLIAVHRLNFRKAGTTIGSRSDAIRRNFIAWATIVQTASAGREVRAAERRFGVYYRSLQNPSTRRFLTLANGRDPWIEGTESDTQPLAPDEGPERVEELTGFLFGPHRVLQDSRQIDDLGKVRGDEGALAVLREERRIDIALEEIPASRDAFYASLRRAYRSAAVANAEAFKFAGDEALMAEAQQLHEITARIVATLGA
jgi:hypothetical protein